MLERLTSSGTYDVCGSVRRADVARATGVDYVQVGDLDRDTDWSDALAGCDAVIHTAARVHVMRDTALDPLAEFRRVNVDGTLNLARQAVAKGVRRFVFVSSIKVNGEETAAGRAFTPDDVPAPADSYGRSKLEAEQGVAGAAGASGPRMGHRAPDARLWAGRSSQFPAHVALASPRRAAAARRQCATGAA